MIKHHQYGISVLIFQMSSCKETSGSVAKCCLFSQASSNSHYRSLRLLACLQVELKSTSQATLWLRL